jgi:hypothetical protein
MVGEKRVDLRLRFKNIFYSSTVASFGPSVHYFWKKKWTKTALFENSSFQKPSELKKKLSVGKDRIFRDRIPSPFRV